MNKYSFSTKKGKAYYCNSIPGFIRDESHSIVGHLVNHAFEINKNQSDAWENQINRLQDRLENSKVDGDIIFEYDIVRLGKRIDIILLIRNMVFSLEFKNGKDIFTAQDAQQAEDYAIDIKNFHKESEDLYVCPILIATNAKALSKDQSIECYPDKQIFLQRENIDTLIPKVKRISEKYGEDKKIDFERWFNSPYYPTPTIISAAVEAYKTHNLSDIAQSEAGQDNIDYCEEKIANIIEYARTEKKKCMCFITGVPGAGKTLVGLDIASKNIIDDSKLSVYLSGNGPLVEVLREALKMSVKQDEKEKGIKHTAKEKEVINESINHLIESSFHFKKEYANNSEITPENILIFDEAQRVWSSEKMAKKHNNDPSMDMSEAKLIVNIMDRHNDWAVLVLLVGLGQDIYDGEVGINEWFRCGIEDFPDWEMYYSKEIFKQFEDKTINNQQIINCNRCYECDALHLKTSIRSFRAEKQCDFVDCLLDDRPDEAKSIYNEIANDYPIFVTRNYSLAKKWVKEQVRGSQRCGVLASSGAKRLMAEGIYIPKDDMKVKEWFLAPTDDIRSSNMLEVVASEFKVQGLEIDWSVVCWDADLRRNSKNMNWDYYSFRGSKWNHRNDAVQQRYLINSYRVLLTRARQGLIIYVPVGTAPEEDETRNSKYYDDVYDYLISCGIKPYLDK